MLELIYTSHDLDDAVLIEKMLLRYSTRKERELVKDCAWSVGNFAGRFKRIPHQVRRNVYANARLYPRDSFLKAAIDSMEENICEFVRHISNSNYRQFLFEYGCDPLPFRYR